MVAREAGQRWFEANLSLLVLLFGVILGCASFAYYYAQGLTTAHYDAKAHLVVARRISDSIEPGYFQVGVHWLPLSHLLYWPFTLSDTQYRTGVLPSLLSVLSFSLSVWLVFRIARRVTGSAAAGVFAAGFIAANANLQYLQSCPLTEPLYMALSLLSLDAVIAWRDRGMGALPWLASIWTALAGLCRYEGWYLLAGIFVVLAWDFWKKHQCRRTILRAAVLFAAIFALPAVTHFAYVYAKIGDSFFHRVVRGHPVPYETFRRPILASIYHLGELAQIAAIIPLLVGITGTLYCLARPNSSRQRAPLFLLWLPSILNVTALYWGHIYRVRYSVLLLPALAIFGSILVPKETALRRILIGASLVAMALPWLAWRFPREWEYRFFYPGPGIVLLPAASLIIFLWAHGAGQFRWPLLALCVLAAQIPTLQGEALPILSETREHAFMEPDREAVLAYLREHYDGTRVLIDIERQAPLIYDSGLPVKEFVYNEGQRMSWDRTLQAPQGQVGWLCAEKGDEVWRALQVDPPWADRYSLAVTSENLRLYKLRWEDREPPSPVRRKE